VGSPAQDVLAGVDAMIANGTVDSQRMGMLGFSYGETLTMAALTTDNRFKAAVVGGRNSDLLMAMLHACATSSEGSWAINRDMFGIPNPYDAKNIERMYDQTAVFHLARLQVPLLIESGEYDGYIEHQQLFAGFRHFGVPVEHIVYPRSGHGWDAPSLLPILRDAALRAAPQDEVACESTSNESAY